MAKIAFVGNKTTTLECMAQFLRDGFQIDLLVTLKPEAGEKHQVAGYTDLGDFAAKNGIPVYNALTYALSSEEDKRVLTGLGMDCLLVIGWQRLIPQWWLETLSIGAFGMHGSPEPLPRGRGRSPMNWSLLRGKTSFMTHLFKYDPGVDSGGVVGMRKFDITGWDDCDTLHMKNRMAMNRLIKEHLPSILDGSARYSSQSKEVEPTYFPKRTDEDGRVIWGDLDMAGLFNHIRCQTKPFPGAFSHLNRQPGKFYFWKAHPFDSHLIFYDALPGTVVEVFHDASFLVSVWDGSVRVFEYSGEGVTPRLGDRFFDHPA